MCTVVCRSSLGVFVLPKELIPPKKSWISLEVSNRALPGSLVTSRFTTKGVDALIDLALVAFWGMARLSELTYHVELGLPQRQTEIRVQDSTI